MSRIIPPNTVIIDPVTGKQAAVESNGALAVNIQDQHSLALDLHFIQLIGSITTTAALITAGDSTVTLTDTTGFVDGVQVGISDTTNFSFAQQVGAPAGAVITLDRPIDNDYANGVNAFAASRSMNVTGALGAPEVFQIGPVGAATGIEIDITRVMGYLQDGTAMDDALFGSLAALTNGVLLRKNIGGGDYVNYWNCKTNGELALECFDFAYTTKAPAGSFGARFRNTYAGQAKHGVTIRLAPTDTLELVVQDDLTGLEAFNMMAQGHYVTD